MSRHRAAGMLFLYDVDRNMLLKDCKDTARTARYHRRDVDPISCTDLHMTSMNSGPGGAPDGHPQGFISSLAAPAGAGGPPASVETSTNNTATASTTNRQQPSPGDVQQAVQDGGNVPVWARQSQSQMEAGGDEPNGGGEGPTSNNNSSVMRKNDKQKNALQKLGDSLLFQKRKQEGVVVDDIGVEEGSAAGPGGAGGGGAGSSSHLKLPARSPRQHGPMTQKMAEQHKAHQQLSPKKRAMSMSEIGAPPPLALGAAAESVSRPVTSSAYTSSVPLTDDSYLPLAIYSTTKLRSWRTGYPRTVSLHGKYFTTSDPDTGEVTNTWNYTGLRQWMALPKEAGCVLLEVVETGNGKDAGSGGSGGSTKLKFKLRGVDGDGTGGGGGPRGSSSNSVESNLARGEMLALMLRYKYETSASSSMSGGGTSAGGGGTVTLPAVVQHNFPAFGALRHTRNGSKVPVTLVAAPYGLVELVGQQQHLTVVRTYLFTTIVGVSLTADDPNGIVLHILETKSRFIPRSADAQHQQHPGRLYYVTSSHRSGSGSTGNKGGGGNGRSDLISSLNSYYGVLGLNLRMGESTTVANWTAARLRWGTVSAGVGSAIGSFGVMKLSARHASAPSSDGGVGGGFIPRELVLTRGGYLVERDRNADASSGNGRGERSSGSGGGGVVSCRSLCAVRCLVRHEADPDHDLRDGGPAMTIEFASNSGDSTSGMARTYTCTNRDALIVAILDSARSLANNKSITVTSIRSAGYRLLGVPSNSAQVKGDLFHPDPNQIQCLRHLHQISCAAVAYLDSYEYSSFDARRPVDVIEECDVVVEACQMFSANVKPAAAGILDGEKKIVGAVIEALAILLVKLLESSDGDDDHDIHNRIRVQRVATPLFQALYRLCCTVTGFRTAVECQDILDVMELIWDIDDTFALYWAMMTFSALLSRQGVDPSMILEGDKEAEFVNKRVLLGLNGTVGGLVRALLGQRGGKQRSSVSDLIRLVVGSVLESILCSHSSSTSPEHFSSLLAALSSHHRALMSMVENPIPIIIENTALILHVISTRSPETARAIRENSLSSSTILHHFHLAIFSPLEGQRFLSRYLCSLWFSGPPNCQERRLLRRMLPIGTLSYLKMPILSQTEEDQLDELERVSASGESLESAQSYGLDTGGGTNIKRLRSRISSAISAGGNGTHPENFRIFFHVLTKDHCLPDLIWNQETRRALRIALEAELQSIHRVMESRGGRNKIAWNHHQFKVAYPSLGDQIQVGDYYLRPFLQAGDGFIKSVEDPAGLFELLFRRLLGELDRDAVVTNICVRCLERLYAVHWEKIGVFPDLMILIHCMSSTKNIETRHRLLSLVGTLLGVVSHVNLSDNATGRSNATNIPDNGEQLLNGETIGILCEFVAFGHTNMTQVSNMLSSAVRDDSSGGDNDKNKIKAVSSVANASCPPVWFVGQGTKIPPPSDAISGPYKVSELAEMMQEGKLHARSLISSIREDTSIFENAESDTTDVKEAQIDTGKWRTLDKVCQLRWQLCSDDESSAVYTPAEVAFKALQSFNSLLLHPSHSSLDPRGIPYFPIPKVKRFLSDSRSALPILSQALLCDDPQVVESSAILLSSLMDHNDDACAKLYLTGAFLFACVYTGSNYRPLAKLLYDTHLRQVFQSGHAAAASADELDAKDRSILGNLLPEGLLMVLVNDGYERFSDVFVGNLDAPEVIWSFEMRKHLVSMIRQHLGDFPNRLRQNTMTEFEYIPIPGISYKQLRGEIFCHNFYLRNLCDESKFPNVQIAEPVEVFRACLNEWKKQMIRDQDQEEDAQEKARKVMGLRDGDGGNELRRAYRSLARRYHPDKNPGGRDKFEEIQRSYELLLPVVEQGGTIQATSSDDDDEDRNAADDNSSEGWTGGRIQMQNVHLLLRAQLLICKRYGQELSIFKYPSYSLLLACLQIPASDSSRMGDGKGKRSKVKNGGDDVRVAALANSCLLKPKRAEVVTTAAALVFETCLVSPLNAEELVNEGGITTLVELLLFYVDSTVLIRSSSSRSGATKATMASLSTAHETIINLVHTIGGVAFFERGRKALLALDTVSDLCLAWRRCIDGSLAKYDSKAKALVLKKYALEGIANMAYEARFQELLIRSGVIWPMVRCLLHYDQTLSADAQMASHGSDAQSSQAASNEHAAFAARGLGMLCGLMCGDLQTPSNKDLYEALRSTLTKPIAKMLRNERSIEILRTLNTNAETPTFVWNAGMRDELSLFLDKMEKRRGELGLQSIDIELKDSTKSFRYTNLATEVAIGGVYLRIFNSLGDGREAIRHINDCSVFGKDLIYLLARSLEQSDELPAVSFPFALWADSDSRRDDETRGGNIEKDIEIFPISDVRFSMAIKSLRLLVRIDGLIDDVLCDEGCPAVLLHMLNLPTGEAFDTSCDILSLLSPKQVFADAVASQNELWRIIRVLEREHPVPPLEEEMTLAVEAGDNQDSEGTRPGVGQDNSDGAPDEEFNVLKTPSAHVRVWEILESLSSSPSLGIDLIKSGAWIELLGIIVGYRNFTKAWTARVGAAKLISRLLWAPETGPLISPLLYKFLPNALISMLKDEGAEAMLSVFDKESKLPDLIWDAEMRGELRKGVREILDDLMRVRDAKAAGDACPSDDDGDFTLPPTFSVRYPKLWDELYIGGIYVRLFLKEPSFKLRDPNWFLESLLLRWMQELNAFTGDRTNDTSSDGSTNNDETTGSELVSSQGDILEQITSAAVCLCKLQPHLCNKLAEWGYIGKAIAFIHRAVALKLTGSPLLSAVRLLHVAASDRENIEAMAVVGDVYGKGGLVDGILCAINGDPLHKDTAFMIETLEKVFVAALGDLDSAGFAYDLEQNTESITTNGSIKRELGSAPADAFETNQTNQTQDDPALHSDPSDFALCSPNEEAWHPSEHSVPTSSEEGMSSSEPMVMGGHSSVQLNYAPGSFHALPPSPAPGLEPVSKMDPGTDPLSSLMNASSSTPLASASPSSSTQPAPLSPSMGGSGTLSSASPHQAQVTALSGPTNVPTSVGERANVIRVAATVEQQQPPRQAGRSFAARSQAAYASSPVPARSSTSTVTSQPGQRGLSFAQRSQMQQQQQQQPQLQAQQAVSMSSGHAVRSQAATPQMQPTTMGFAARSQAMNQGQATAMNQVHMQHQLFQQQSQPQQSLMHGRYYGTSTQPQMMSAATSTSAPSTTTGQGIQYRQHQTNIGVQQTQPGPIGNNSMVGYAARSQAQQQQVPTPAPATVASVSASSYVARSNQYQNSDPSSTTPTSTPATGGYAARSQMLMSNNNPAQAAIGAATTTVIAPPPAPAPAPTPISLATLPVGQMSNQQSLQQHPIVTAPGLLQQTAPQQHIHLISTASAGATAAPAGQCQNPPSTQQQPPSAKSVEPNMQTVQQYGRGSGEAGLMHGRYYERSTQHFSVSHPSPAEVQTRTENDISAAATAMQQSHQETLASVPVIAPAPAPAPAPAQPHPEMPTPMTGSSIIDTTSCTPTIEESTEEGTGAPGSVFGRVALLNSALSCNLPGFLVDQVLENSALPSIKDPTGAKVHAVSLLKVLAADPAYGTKISHILDNLEGWKKYKSQDHSLFITGAEQKADYFLLDQGHSSKKLLTHDDGESEADDEKDGKVEEKGYYASADAESDGGGKIDEGRGKKDEGKSTGTSEVEEAEELD